jgi:hypothetical protein
MYQAISLTDEPQYRRNMENLMNQFEVIYWELLSNLDPELYDKALPFEEILARYQSGNMPFEPDGSEKIYTLPVRALLDLAWKIDTMGKSLSKTYPYR